MAAAMSEQITQRTQVSETDTYHLCMHLLHDCTSPYDGSVLTGVAS